MDFSAVTFATDVIGPVARGQFDIKYHERDRLCLVGPASDLAGSGCAAFRPTGGRTALLRRGSGHKSISRQPMTPFEGD
jgi:hypothetical protein